MTTVEPSAASAMMSQGDWTRITMYPTCSSAAAKGSPGKEGQWRYSRGPGPPVPHLRSVWSGRYRQGRSCGRRRLRGCGPPGRRAGSFPRAAAHIRSNKTTQPVLGNGRTASFPWYGAGATFDRFSPSLMGMAVLWLVGSFSLVGRTAAKAALDASGLLIGLQPPGEHADVQGLPGHRERVIPVPRKWTFPDSIRVLPPFLSSRQGKPRIWSR